MIRKMFARFLFSFVSSSKENKNIQFTFDFSASEERVKDREVRSSWDDQRLLSCFHTFYLFIHLRLCLEYRSYCCPCNHIVYVIRQF